MKMLQYVMLAAILFVALGCVQGAPESQPDGALLRALLPPASLGGNLSLSQLIVGEFKDQRHSLHVEIEVTAKRMVVAGLTPIGVPIFTLKQEADVIEVEIPGSENFPFNPRYMLSDFQIAYWPEAVLSDKFRSVGLIVKETLAQGSREVINEAGEVLVAVTYVNKPGSAGDIIIEHFDPPYRLQIKTFKRSDF